MMSIKGIIFDFGFTLFYFEDVSLEKYLDCYQQGLRKSVQHLKELNILTNERTIDKFFKFFNKKRMDFFKESLKTMNEYTTIFIFQHVLKTLIQKEQFDSLENLDEKLYMKLADLYHSYEEDKWKPFNHTKKTLDALSQKGIKMAVLSNHPHDTTIKKLLNKYELSPFFATITTSAKFGRRKPDPEIFKYTLNKMGFKNAASECLMCGDEHADIVGGNQAGLKTILCEREIKFPYEKEIAFPDLVSIDNISKVLEFI